MDESNEPIKNIERIIAGNVGACAIDDEKELYCWGSIGGNTGLHVKESATHLLSNVIDVETEGHDTCAAFTNGKLGCWPYFLPDEIEMIDGFNDVHAFTTRGNNRFVAISGDSDQLVSKHVGDPQVIDGVANVKKVSIYKYRPIFILRSGSMWSIDSSSKVQPVMLSGRMIE